MVELDPLRLYGTCEVSDALRKLKLSNFFIGDLPIFSSRQSEGSGKEMKVVGPAYTINMVVADDAVAPRLPSDVHWLDGATKGDMVIIASPPGILTYYPKINYCKGQVNAVFGGLMGARASYLDVAGVIVNGRIRDVLELNSQGLTVLAKGQSSMGAGGFTRASTINEPLLFPISNNINEPNHVTIQPGDIVMADQDGVVVIPVHLLDEVVQMCEKLVEMDRKCMSDITNGSTITAAFKAHRS